MSKSNWQSILTALRQEFPPHLVRTHKEHGYQYLTAATIMDRLDSVVGLDWNWDFDDPTYNANGDALRS